MSPSVAEFSTVARLAGLTALAFAFVTPACGDTVRVHKKVQPWIAFTTFVHASHSDSYSCWPASCLDELGTGSEPDLPNGQILVGYIHLYDLGAGFGPCHCSDWAYEVARGMVLFKIDDIPHHFKSATLVLKAQNVQFADPLPQILKVPFSGIFETSHAASSPLSLPGDVAFDPSNGQLTATFDNGDGTLFGFDDNLQKPVTGASPFPLPPYPSGAVLEETAPFSYRLDVTATVNAWFADWLKREDTPLRGFIMVGTDESLPQDDNADMQVTYTVALEFDIDEPDR
jgi:hypothetical protein